MSLQAAAAAHQLPQSHFSPEQALLFEALTPPLRPHLYAEMRTLITQYTISPFPSFVNLSSPHVLRSYLAPRFRSDDYLLKAIMVAQRIYEVAPRAIQGEINEGGMAFPMDPEVMAYVMSKLTPEDTVLEIGAGGGECAALLAFTGARVYANDINGEERKGFEALKSKLPREIAGRVTWIPGCCSTLPDQGELRKKIDWVVCRNFFHLFDDKQKHVLFQNIRNIVKPGGKVIFVANSLYGDAAHQSLQRALPEATSFIHTQCLVTNYDRGNAPVLALYRKLSVAPPGVRQPDKTLYPFMRVRGVQNSNWVMDPNAFQELDPETHDEIGKRFNEQAERIYAIQEGYVQVLIKTVQAYTTHTLTALLLKHKFQVEASFVVQSSGHLCLTPSPWGLGFRVGAIVRLSS